MMIDTDDFTKFAMYISLCMYLSLVALNFFWFNKMFMGLPSTAACPKTFFQLFTFSSFSQTEFKLFGIPHP